VRGRRHVVVELALAVVERESASVVAGFFQIVAVFAEQRRDLGGGAGALVLGERLVGVTPALDGLPRPKRAKPMFALLVAIEPTSLYSMPRASDCRERSSALANCLRRSLMSRD
jgi:hypothetical protein